MADAASVSCGQLIKVCIGERGGIRQFRPAIIVEVHDVQPEPLINAQVFLDGRNDSWVQTGGAFTVAADRATAWATSLRHGRSPGEWCRDPEIG